MSNWRERYTANSREEKRRYDAIPVSVLLDDIKNKRYGVYDRIWYSVAERATLREAGAIILDVLESDAEYLVRCHAAQALMALAHLHDWNAFQLTVEAKYPVRDNLKKVREIVEQKLKFGDHQSGTSA